MNSQRLRQVAVIVGAVLLGASLWENLHLLRLARSLERHLHATQLDPLGVETAQPDPGAKVTRRVVLFGDSRAAQWPLDLPSTQVLNHGVNGQTSAQAALRFAAQIPALEPDVVIIQVGMNDLRAIAVLPADEQTIVDACKRHISAIVKQARAAGARVVVTTLFPLGGPISSELLHATTDLRDPISEVNAHIRSLTGEGVEVIDAYALLAGDNGFVRPAFYIDTLHINQAGYEVLNADLVF